MARPLDPHATLSDDEPEATAVAPGVAKQLDRAAARAFAAAISSLIIATLVVTQSSQALDPEGTVASSSVGAGTVTLVDDDLGRSLVHLTDMSPATPSEECINVTYEGTVLPVDVRLAATVSGGLADYLSVEVERGTGGGFGSCEDFVPLAQVSSGSLGDLGRSRPIALATLRNTQDDMTFRFRFEVLDDERAVGQSVAVDFVWEAVPS